MQQGADLTCRLWNSFVSECHVHLLVNLMSALMRQQVDLSVGWSTFVSLSVSILHAVQVPTFNTLENSWCADVVPEHVSLQWEWKSISQYTGLDISLCKGELSIFTSLSAQVTSPVRQFWRVKHDVIALKISIQKGLFVSGLGRLNVPSKYYDVIDKLTGMQHGTSATLVDSCTPLVCC